GQRPKLPTGFCGHAGAYVRLNLHLGWQAAESYVERSNAFALIPGHRLLPDCSASITSSAMAKRYMMFRQAAFPPWYRWAADWARSSPGVAEGTQCNRSRRRR